MTNRGVIMMKKLTAFRKKKFQPKDQKAHDKKIKLISAIATSKYIDSHGVCYDIKILSDNSLDPTVIESLYKAKLPSFQAFGDTRKISLNADDFSKIVLSHESYINDISQITGRSYEQVMLDFAAYHKNQEFLVQPRGISGVLHKLSNGAYVSSAALQSAFATATSHVSGVTGLSLLGSAPGLIIFVPLVGGVFFASVERLAANTPAQPVLILARDACLITPKVAEIAYNEIFVGPFLRWAGIDAPLNVTSMLRFGSGTKRIMGGVVNATVSTILKASPINYFN